jgi:hypothetical protein
MKRDFPDAPSGCISANQDFLEEVEVPGDDLQVCEDLPLIHAQAAREVVNRDGEHAPVGLIERPAERRAGQRHLGAAPLGIAGANDDLGLTAAFPQLGQEDGPVR